MKIIFAIILGNVLIPSKIYHGSEENVVAIFSEWSQLLFWHNINVGGHTPYNSPSVNVKKSI